ncbi:hypothetical protein FOL47_006769 [Perkinsus chesapeaki]|uniref:Uncharacterized protein n=1 Tax=Perkinsus chesapeaki TaxID=330153 RepID=A0A7J6LPN0_PERCH|nr:hypothetical protein FOL47_006769 [Perkinsus chesapeaki]
MSNPHHTTTKAEQDTPDTHPVYFNPNREQQAEVTIRLQVAQELSLTAEGEQLYHHLSPTDTIWGLPKLQDASGSCERFTANLKLKLLLQLLTIVHSLLDGKHPMVDSHRAVFELVLSLKGNLGGHREEGSYLWLNKAVF